MLAVLFLAASIACLILGSRVHPMAYVAEKSQIVLSALSATIGATVVWLLLTFLFGRIYCGTVCPVGTLTDLVFRLRRRIPRLNRPFSFRPPSRIPVHVLWIYIVCLLLGLGSVTMLVEPWNITRNIVAAFRPSHAGAVWTEVGLGMVTGMAAAILSLIVIAAVALWRGREFCTSWCPVGYALGKIGDRSMWQLEIDPDRCISCGKCEDNCRASCIKTVSRYIDNSRCIRCFDCAADCPQQAIRFQRGKNRPATPLFTRTKRSKT